MTTFGLGTVAAGVLSLSAVGSVMAPLVAFGGALGAPQVRAECSLEDLALGVHLGGCLASGPVSSAIPSTGGYISVVAVGTLTGAAGGALAGVAVGAVIGDGVSAAAGAIVGAVAGLFVTILPTHCATAGVAPVTCPSALGKVDLRDHEELSANPSGTASVARKHVPTQLSSM